MSLSSARPIHVIATARSFRSRVLGESLYRNSTFLFVAGIVNAGFSFLFWVVAARLYTQSDVGHATALFAAVTMVGTLSTLGFNNSLIRYLPRATDQQKVLNTVYTLVGVAAIVLAVICLLVIPDVAQSLAFARRSAAYAAVFVLFVASTALSTIVDNNFTAYRATHYTLAKNIVLNLAEFALLFVFLGSGSFGLFSAYAIAFAFVVALSFVTLKRRFSVAVRPRIDLGVARTMSRFSLANYLTTYLNSLPAVAVPLIVTSQLGAQTNAVYYIAYNVSYVLFLIPIGIANALFAEASHESRRLVDLVGRSVKMTALVVIPAVAAIEALAPVLLLLFGRSYSAEGTSLLRILALSGIPIAVCYPAGAILNVRYRVRTLVLVNALGSSVLVSLVYLLARHGADLDTIGWGWVIGWSVYALFYVIALSGSIRTASRTISANRGASAS